MEPKPQLSKKAQAGAAALAEAEAAVAENVRYEAKVAGQAAAKLSPRAPAPGALSRMASLLRALVLRGSRGSRWK